MLLRSALLLAALGLCRPPYDACAEMGVPRVRLVPARTVATLDVNDDDHLHSPPFKRLRAWAEAAGAKPVGPEEEVLDAPASPKQRLRFRRLSIRIEVASEGAPAASEGQPRFERLPAALVFERERWYVKSMDVYSGVPSPPVAEMKRRGLVYAGRYERLRYASAYRTDRLRLVERWHVTPRGRADIGLYTGPGAHANSVRTAAAACLDAKLTIRPLVASDLNDGSFRKAVRVVLVPGGWAVPYTTDIHDTGIAHLRTFVKDGGGYVGVCAGAFYAASTITWEGTTHDYPLDLVQGRATGPLPAIAPWPRHALAKIELEPKHPLARGLPASREVFYLGGCALHLEASRTQSHEVVARYAKGNAPAIVTVRVGKGRAFLCGVHLEYDLTSDRDDLAWPESAGVLKDPEPDWDLFQRGVRWAVGSAR